MSPLWNETRQDHQWFELPIFDGMLCIRVYYPTQEMNEYSRPQKPIHKPLVEAGPGKVSKAVKDTVQWDNESASQVF